MTRTVQQQALFEMALEIMGFQSQYPTISLILGQRFDNFQNLNGAAIDKCMASRKKIFDEFVQKSEGNYIMEQHEGQGRFTLIEEIRRTEFNNKLTEWGTKLVEVII